MGRTVDVEAELAEMRGLLQAQQAKIEALEQRRYRKWGALGGNGSERASRRDLFKLAGAGVAGAAGIAVLGAEPAVAVNGSALTVGNNNATTNTASAETKLVVSGSPGSFGDGVGFAVDASGAPAAGIWGVGGAVSSGTSGAGVVGAGGNANVGGVTAGDGVFGTGGSGNPAGAGVRGTGGNLGGDGVVGIGSGTGRGVLGNGGNGGAGVAGFGGPTAGNGVTGQGGGAGRGLLATGGSSSGIGVEAHGGAPNGIGVYAVGGGAGSPLLLNQAASAGPPTSSSFSHAVGEVWVDLNGTVWVCVAGGFPGTWMPLQQGQGTTAGSKVFYRSAITTQPTLVSSDGATWTDMDAGLGFTLNPPFNSLAILTANLDLFTDTGGYNQDIGITVSGGAYPTTPNQPEAWKESGGFAGIYSPNAAYVQTALPLLGGTSYLIKLQWKTNKSAPGVRIYAGAGAIAGRYSPTSLTALLIPMV